MMFKELQTLLHNRHAIVRTLTRRHIYISATILFLLLIAFTSLHSAIEQQRNDSYLINISGKQRMLSQRIVSLSQNIAYRQATKRDFQEFHDELKLSLHEFSYIHRTLSEKVLQPTHLHTFQDSQLVEVYFGPWKLAQKLEVFLRNATLMLSSENAKETLALSRKLSSLWDGKGGLLGVLELGTLTFQLESERRVSMLQKIALGTAIFIVLLLFIEAYFVTRTTLIELSNTINNETSKNDSVDS